MNWTSINSHFKQVQTGKEISEPEPDFCSDQSRRVFICPAGQVGGVSCHQDSGLSSEGLSGCHMSQPHGQSQVTELFRDLLVKPTNTEERFISQQGLLTHPRPTWCTSNWSADTCWGNSTSKFFLTLYLFSFLQSEKICRLPKSHSSYLELSYFSSNLSEM